MLTKTPECDIKGDDTHSKDKREKETWWEAGSVLWFPLMCTAWVASSMCLVFALKIIIDPLYLGFKYPIVVTIISLTGSSIILAVAVNVPDAIRRCPRKAALILIQYAAPLGVFTVVEIGTSNVAYLWINVSLICVLKCTTTLTTFVVAVFTGDEPPCAYTFSLMVGMVLGVCLCVRHLLTANVSGLYGVIAMLISAVAFTFRSLLAKRAQAAYEFTSWEMSYMLMPFAAIFLLPWAMWSESSFVGWRPEKPELSYVTVLAILGLPVIGLVNMASLLEVVRMSSPLTMAVLVAFRQVLSILGAVAFFQDHWTVKAGVGLTIALLTTVEYARIRAKRPKQATHDVEEGEREPLLPGSVSACNDSERQS